MSIKPIPIAFVAVLLLFGYSFPRLTWGFEGSTIARARSFYGILEVQDHPAERVLLHGKTVHGSQWKSPAYRRFPTTYYGPDSGIGQLMRYHPKRNPASPMRIGVVGLGAGTLAAYGLPGDYMRFYELDPDLLQLVRGPHAWFSYLDDSPARIDVVLGDARLSLEREAAAGARQNFDVLVLDAFNGDAIPVHLLTREAMQTCLYHLAPEGALAAHISSSALDLSPVLLGLMEEFHLHGSIVHANDSYTNSTSIWVILSPDLAALRTPGLRRYGGPLTSEGKPVLWTDDYSNVIGLLHRW
jgi:hypothetical protein